jgi:serine protease Do
MFRLLIIAVLVLVGIPTVVSADESRITPIVKAVKTANPCVVTIRVMAMGNYGKATPVIGTGVIVADLGYVVTNSHVVNTASEAEVQLYDNTKLSGVVVWNEPSKDLAVIRLPLNRKYPSLTFAPSSDLMLGETVIAIGNPLGYRLTVSTGIVSATGRILYQGESNELHNIIQTTASINPGNSGGPLLNINGELIGIVCAVREGAEGIAFALSGDDVEEALARAARQARHKDLNLGLECSRVVQLTAPRQQLKVETSKSPDFKRGDLIRTVGGRTVSNYMDLERALFELKSGEQVAFVVVRGDKEVTVTIKLP